VQRAMLATEANELGALGGSQSVRAHSQVSVGLGDPSSDRLRGWTVCLRQVVRRPPRTGELDQLLPELCSVRRASLRHVSPFPLRKHPLPTDRLYGTLTCIRLGESRSALDIFNRRTLQAFFCMLRKGSTPRSSRRWLVHAEGEVLPLGRASATLSIHLREHAGDRRHRRTSA
jgi:hypothetical protein